MKILQINAVYGVSSTGKIVRDISDGLIAEGHSSYIMWATACKSNGAKAELIRLGNTLDHKLHALLRRIDGAHGMHSRLATKIACRKILEISPDVVHLHNLHSNYIHLAMLLKFLAKNNIPTLITMHDCWFVGGYCMHYMYHNCNGWLNGCERCPAVNKLLRKKVTRRFEERKKLYSSIKRLAVNGVSRWTTETAKKSILGVAKSIETIYNWVDTEIFAPKDNRDEVAARFGITDGKKIILGVSQSWCQGKGLDTFLYLAEELSDIAYVILVGENCGVPDRDNLRCIGFTSNVDELVELYSAADVFVNASEAETFGLVTVEAMACGTPVVAYDNSGSSEIISEDCGVLVEDGNKAAILKGVSDILSKDKKQFSDACVQRVFKYFEKTRQIERYIKFYEHISSSK